MNLFNVLLGQNQANGGVPLKEMRKTMPNVTQIHVNGTLRQIDADPERTLLSVLRDDLDLTGCSYGCGEGECGACTVLINGLPRRSCILPIKAVGERKIITIEGLGTNGKLHALQQAFLDEEAFQCGYCTPGMIMSGVGLLMKNPNPTREEIIHFMDGNICRCGTYTRIIEAIDGVTVVRDGDFIGVTAPNEQIAERAIEALQAKWKTKPQISNNELFIYLKDNVSEGRGGGWRDSFRSEEGAVEEGLQAANIKLKKTYTIDYIAHCPLEPRAAVAVWEDGKVTVWTGTQRPFGVQEELMRAFRLPPEKARVIMPDTGSGYGGKHTGEAALEAARLAKEAGKPVKVVWTREEEFTWAYFRPAGVIEVTSGVQKDGTITAWDFHNYNSGGAGIQSKYGFPNQRNEFHRTDSPLRQGSYRCLAATANHFAREVHIDELAHAVNMDPLAFRLKNCQDERLRYVFEKAAEQFGWDQKKSTVSVGYGIAGGFEKNSYMANCAEVAIDRDKGTVKVIRVVQAFDCGPVTNPDQLTNQIEGMIMMGIGGALRESIKFNNGKILNPRFSEYEVPRFSDAPIIETVLIDRKDIPAAGGGETPIVGIAPAISNAIFAATGIRLRSMPMVPDGFLQ